MCILVIELEVFHLLDECVNHYVIYNHPHLLDTPLLVSKVIRVN